VKVSRDKSLDGKRVLVVNGQFMATITQRQGGERRVIYSILINKSKLPPQSISGGGQEGSKDNIPGKPWLFQAEETLASFPLLESGIWPLAAG
jgi:hypothetical protein